MREIRLDADGETLATQSPGFDNAIVRDFMFAGLLAMNNASLVRNFERIDYLLRLGLLHQRKLVLSVVDRRGRLQPIPSPVRLASTRLFRGQEAAMFGWFKAALGPRASETTCVPIA